MQKNLSPIAVFIEYPNGGQILQRADILGRGVFGISFQALERGLYVSLQGVHSRDHAVYNVTNSFRLDNPTTQLNSVVFGRINSSLPPRIMRFALKYMF